MKTTLKTSLMLALMLSSGIALAQDVRFNASVGGQISPGVYGRVDIGTAPPPPVVYAQPIVVVHQPRPVHVQPIYMNVPPGHAKKWSKHCHKYNACSQPVYFVKTAEYDHGGRGHGKKHKD